MDLESLANELLLDIFDFLKAVHLLRAFHGLNSRLNNLLVNHFQTHSLDFRSVSKYDFDIVCQQQLPSIANRISSLRLSDDDDTPQQPDLFLSYGLTLRRFTHLRTLSLYHLRSTEIMDNFMLDCHHLSHLTHLIITLCYFDTNPEGLFNNIWSLPVLVRCHLDFIFMNSSHVPTPTVISSSLEHLSVVDDPYDLISLTRLFESTPHLRNLSVHINDFSDTHQLPSIVPLITTMKLTFNGSLRVLTNLLQNTPNLCQLTIEIEYMYLNGYQWEQLIVNSLPRLKVFRFQMVFHLTHHTTKEVQVDELLDSFRTRFWLDERQWFVRCDWDPHNTESSTCLYSLPYPFDEYICLHDMRSKSTSPNDRKYWSYDRVHKLWYNSFLTTYVAQVPIRFSNIRHLELSFPFDDHFWPVFPTLDRVTTLELLSRFCDTNDNNLSSTQLRDLLDQTPCLNSLTIDYLLVSQLLEVQSTNASIYQLDLQPNDGHFYGIECISLIHSLLNVRCQVLHINVENRTIVLDLVDSMPNLRALTFQSLDDTWESDGSSSTEDEIVQWLQHRLSSTCSISRDTSERSGIRLWIR